MNLCGNCGSIENLKYSKKFTSHYCSSKCWYKIRYKYDNKDIKKRALESHYNNKEHHLNVMSKYRKSGKARKSWDKWYEKEENREKHIKLSANYYKNNTQKCIKNSYNYKKKRMKIDPAYKLREYLASLIGGNMRKQGAIKSDKTEAYIGCSILEFKKKLEEQFTEGISWNNRDKWHVDHIIPCCSFNLLDDVEAKKCYHYSNCRPMWATDNLKKSSQDKKLKYKGGINDKRI